jgi:hypothetical protein
MRKSYEKPKTEKNYKYLKTGKQTRLCETKDEKGNESAVR